MRAALAVCGAALLAACSAPAATSAGGATGGGAPTAPEGITYQPGVVAVGGGEQSVRSVSADGLVWTLDANAPGLADLDVGEIMFLSARAVGRAMTIDRAGDTATVTLAPVQFTDVIRDGHLSLDTDVDADDAEIQVIPEQPGSVTEPDGSGTDLQPPGFARRAEARGGSLPSPVRSKAEVTIGDWGIGAAASSSGLTVSATYKIVENAKVGAEVTIGWSKLHLAADLTLGGGVLSAAPTMVLSGIDFIDVNLFAGTATGVNPKVRLEIPMELLNKPFLVSGVPMVANFKMKLIVETALTGKNSTLSAHGRWAFNGVMGVEDGKASSPGLKVVNSLMDSIGGLTLGPSGLVVASEARFMLGFGIPGAMAGPYAKLRTSVGVTNGSAFGAPLARCIRGDLIVKGGGGLGTSLDVKATEALRKLIPGMPPFKAEVEVEYLGTIVEKSQTIPDVPLCSAD